MAVKKQSENTNADNVEMLENVKMGVVDKVDWKFQPEAKTYVRNISARSIRVVLKEAFSPHAEILIPAGTSRLMKNSEIMYKIGDGSPSFCGIDGTGANASLFIEDDDFREYVGFDTEESKQFILSDEVMTIIFKKDNLEEFKKTVASSVKTYLEKHKFMKFLREKYKNGSFDSASKIDFIENYTGIKIKQIEQIEE